MWCHFKQILQVIILATAMLVSCSSPQAGIGKYNKMPQIFLVSSYHNTKLQPSDKNISAQPHTLS